MKVVIGVDEVGFGSIAGPLVIAAVAFASDARKPVLKRVKRRDLPVKDSKLLNHALQPLFENLIKAQCVAYEVMERAAWEIDADGVRNVQHHTKRVIVHRLLERIAFQHPEVYDDYRVIIDGEIDIGPASFKYRAIPKADRDVWQVSCASVLAKTAQLRTMALLHAEFSKYGWDQNNGYGTPTHFAAIKKHGVTRHHRKSYRTVKELL